MTDYKISIIIPVYGVEQCIERCAVSLFKQDMNGLEFIFVNDCTPDNSITILQDVLTQYQHLKDCVKIIDMPKNGGVANARNRGLEIATGEYVGFVDSDDWIEPDMYSTLYNRAVENGADIVGCHFIKTYKTYEKILWQPYSNDIEVNVSRLLQGQIFPSICGEIVRRALYVKNGIRLTPNLNAGEDKLINVKLFVNANTVAYTDKPLYHYCLQENSACVQATNKSFYDYLGIVEEIESYLIEKNLGDIYMSSINCMKFDAKMPFYKNESMKDVVRWRQMFPETNKHIFSYPTSDWKTKFELWLAAHGMFYLANMFVSFLLWQNKQKDKIKNILTYNVF